MRRQAMILQVLAVHLARVDGHGAVEEDGDVLQTTPCFQTMEMKQQGLRPADGERGDHDRAATPNRLADDLAQCLLGIAPVVAAIAIGRFHKEVVGLLHWDRVDHHCVAIATEVAGEDDTRAGPVELNGSGPENVADPAQARRRAARHVQRPVEGDGL